MKIPTFQNQVQQEALPTVRRERLVDTRGQSIGAGLQDVGNVVTQIQNEERQKADATAVFDADMALSTWGSDALRVAKQIKGKDVIGSTDKYLSDFDKLAAEQEKNLTSNRAKTVFKQQAQQRRLQYAGQFGTMEDNEREQYYTAQGVAYRTNEQNAAGLSYHDPKAIAAALDRQDASATVQYSKEPPEVLAGIKQDNRDKTYSKVFDQIIADEDLGRAKAYFGAVEGDMNSELAARVKGSIRSLEARKESQAKANQAEQRDILTGDVQDAFAARQMGLPAILPPKSKFITAYGDQGAERYHVVAGQWKAYDVAGIAANMAPAEAMKYMDSLKPTSQTGAADAAESYGLAVKLYAQQRDRLEKDPVAVLTQTQPDLAALQQQATNGDSRSVSNYFRKLTATQQALGVVSPKLLSDGQRDAIAKQLDYDPENPRARTGAINQIKATYGRYYADVMREVAPKLEGQARVMIDMQPDQAVRLDAATAQQKELNDLVKGPDATDINNQLDIELERLASTLVDNADASSRLAEFRNAAELLAKADVLRGTKPQEAAHKAAAAVVNDQYSYVGTMRIPRAYDAAIVSRGASLVQEKLAKQGDVAITPGIRSDSAAAQSDLRSLIGRQGYWVTNEDGTGLVLRIPARTGQGNVYRPDGSRVEMTWDQLVNTDGSDKPEMWLSGKDR